MRWGALVLPGFSNTVALRDIVIPGIVAKEPVGTWTSTPSDRNEEMLKPSKTSQNALGKVPPLRLMTSCTSSRPNVLLSTQKESNPSGYGLSKFGPAVMVDMAGNAVSSIRLKIG